MRYQVRTENPPESAGLPGPVYVLDDGANRADVWPAFGFNCYRWRATHGGRLLDLLYSDTQSFRDGRPTRCGIPILFPFPNRIRAGRYAWDGKDYQLPLNDKTGKNVIHGFACRKPWRIVGQGADDNGAWLTGEFRGSLDSPESAALWPADYQFRLTYRLSAGRLRAEAEVHNPDRKSLPFGLGYHPYFCVTPADGVGAPAWSAEAPARAYWELEEFLPTGRTPPVDAGRDLNRARRVSDFADLDDILTGLPAPPGADGLCDRGSLRDAGLGCAVRVRTSAAFRELVVFAPPHGKAFCLEPYTCTTNAINLEQLGADAGLLVLKPGETWTGVVEMTCEKADG